MSEQTFALIKSGAIARGHMTAILQRILSSGLTITNMLSGHAIEPHRYQLLYKEHEGRPYYQGLLLSVMGRPYYEGAPVEVIHPVPATALVIEGENAIKRWRAMMGPTDPMLAEAGTIRGDFGGAALPDNAVHGSDSLESARREILIFFPYDVLNARRNATSFA